VRPAPSSPEDRRIVSQADRLGNADGTTTPQELKSLVGALKLEQSTFDPLKQGRLERAEELLQGAAVMPSLDPALRALPEGLRRLALEIDGLWGNADGKVSVAEIDRVAHLYTSAMPFFYDDAAKLLELAAQLHLDLDGPLSGMKATMAGVDDDQRTGARTYRQLFDDALAQLDLPGAPDLIREARLHSPCWHQLSILEHTAAAVRAVGMLEKASGLDWSTAEATLLLHDVGKLLTREVKDADPAAPQFSFWGHTESGADWLKQHAVSDEIVQIVRNHEAIRELGTAQAVIDLAGGDRRVVGKLVLHYLADQAAKGSTPDQLASLAVQKPKVVELAKYAGLDAAKLFEVLDEARQQTMEQVHLADRAGQ